MAPQGGGMTWGQNAAGRGYGTQAMEQYGGGGGGSGGGNNNFMYGFGAPGMKQA